MRSDEFISSLSEFSVEDEQFETLRRGLPLGIDAAGNIVYAQKNRTPFSSRHTCVTGGGKSQFLRRLLITLGCLYEKGEACFFVLSPNGDYGELLKMKSMDVTLPYLREKADLDLAVVALKELLQIRSCGKGYPRLFVVLDGLESLSGCNRNEDLEEVRELLDLLARREDIEVLTGVELTKSIFGGYPAAFVGVGNCLIATRELGKADVTYVQEDGSMTMPLPITYPSAPSLTETVLFFNALAAEGK